MNVITIVILLCLSLNFLYPIFLNFWNNTDQFYLYSLFILLNLLILNIISNIFKKKKDSLINIITKNLKNTLFITTFLLIFLDLQTTFSLDNNIKNIFAVSPLILKPFINSLLSDY